MKKLPIFFLGCALGSITLTTQSAEVSALVQAAQELNLEALKRLAPEASDQDRKAARSEINKKIFASYDDCGTSAYIYAKEPFEPYLDALNQGQPATTSKACHSPHLYITHTMPTD